MPNRSKGRTLQQVGMPPEVQQGLKMLVELDKHDTLNDLYDTAVLWFINRRAKRRFQYYIASNKRSKYVSLWIDSKVLDKVRLVADRDGVSMNRVVYTALVLYLEDNDAL